MKSFHITFILCCLCYCVHSNSDAKNVLQPAKWKPIITTTTTTQAPPPLVSKYSRQARRSHQTSDDENINDTNSISSKSANSVEDVENEDHAKEFDHKQRVLLAVESNLKYRGRDKQQERLKSSPSQNDVPDSRKRLKDGLKDLLSKLHPAQSNSDSMLQKSAPVDEIVTRSSEARKSSSKKPKNKPKKSQRRTYLRTLKCEDIPQSEALLHSGLLNGLNNWRSNSPKSPIVSQPLQNVREAYEMQRNRMSPRRNQMQFFPAYHGYQPIAFPPHPSTFNRFNVHNPYNLFDCNYFLDPVSEAPAPTVQYIWDGYDYDESQSTNSLDTMKIFNDENIFNDEDTK